MSLITFKWDSFSTSDIGQPLQYGMPGNPACNPSLDKFWAAKCHVIRNIMMHNVCSSIGALALMHYAIMVGSDCDGNSSSH